MAEAGAKAEPEHPLPPGLQPADDSAGGLPDAAEDDDFDESPESLPTGPITTGAVGAALDRAHGFRGVERYMPPPRPATVDTVPMPRGAPPNAADGDEADDTHVEDPGEDEAPGHAGEATAEPSADVPGDGAEQEGDGNRAGEAPEPRSTGLPGRAARLATRLTRRGLILTAATGTVAGATGVGISARSVLRDAGATGPEVAGPLKVPRRESKPPPAASRRRAPAAAPGAALVLAPDLSADLLIRRTTYGTSPTLAAAVEDLGMKEWLTRQLKPGSIKDPGGDDIARSFPSLGWSVATTRERVKEGDERVMTALVAAHLGRALWSERQLFEVMVDFWSNHLNIPCPDGAVWDTRHRYDADVIRRHALGRYLDMLAACATHPSMLVHLDNAGSTGRNPNENYARELLEVHTVGIDGGYTERDVRQAALLLSGWRVDDGRAVYDPRRHYVGPVRVLDFAHPNLSAEAGRAAQQALLSHLALHPRTARFIARKLAVRFVADDPPAPLVDTLAAVYLREKTAVVPVLRALFSSAEFHESAGKKVRRPAEHVVATARLLDVRPGRDVQGLVDLAAVLRSAGHQPLGWPLPNGYPDVAAAWQSPAAALEVFNSAANMVHGWWPAKLVFPAARNLLASPPTSRASAVDAVGRRLLGRPATDAERSAAVTLLDGARLPTTFRAGTWEQEQTVALVAILLLSSPAHWMR